MENPRPEKVAVVDEVRERLSAAPAVLLTEYRGLNVTASGELRRALRAAGGDYKIYKNTLVRFAARDLGLDLDELLLGPTALAFVEGDAVNVAKVLRDFARANPALVVKGGLLGTTPLSADEARALADVESRDVLLSKFAGLLAAPLQQFAGLLQALPRNFAYGLKALLDERGGVPEAAVDAAAPAAEAEAEAEAEPAPADAAAATDAPAAAEEPAAADDTPAAAAEPAAADESPAAAEPAAADTESPETDTPAEATADATTEEN
jgi:large subunit ribosomal protein L10